MKRNNTWRFILVLAAIAWSLYELYPPTSGDLVERFAARAHPPGRDEVYTNIVAQARALRAEHPERGFANLRDAVGTNDIAKYFPFFNPGNELYPSTYILNRLQREVAGKIKLGLDLQGGTSFMVEMDTNKLVSIEYTTNAVGQIETNVISSELEGALDQAIEVLRKRVDRFGVAEPVIQAAGPNQILVQLPGLSEADKKSAAEGIKRAAFLEFRLVHENSDELLRNNEIPIGYELLKRKERTPDGGEQLVEVLVKRNAERGLTGGIVKNSSVIRGNLGEPQITFTLNDEGAIAFGRVTRENIERRLAIVLDGVLYSAPVIRSAIETGRGEITGSFDLREARELANVLQNPLRAPLKLVEERAVDPTLGKDSIRSGVTASMIAGVGTFLFMLMFYFGMGLVANLALALNILILMGAMCALGATLTMPGIAGIALTIGMAVDANVLIFERMREEMAAGKSIRGIISSAYDKAFGTIFDSNLTTLIAAIILMNFGTGPVKGFGVTLSIGICVSMFTALVVTRLVYDFLLERNWLTRVRILPLIQLPQFRFMSWGKLAAVVSICLILLGAGATVTRGKSVLGVDFAGGESLTMSFTQRVGEDQLRAALDKAGLGDATINYQKSLSTGLETLSVVVPYEAGQTAQTALREGFPQAEFNVIGTDGVGPTVGAHILRTAIIAALLATFAILMYVAFRYEFSFAVASVIALLHDVLLCLGIYILDGRQLTAPMVAAILTIIGYSINDKIVIMDRVREHLKLGTRGSFREIINLALNQTLSRTIITGGASLLASAALLFFGGGVINDFAFTFLLGILAGTYSSLFIAAPIVLWWHKGHRPNLGSGPLNGSGAATAVVTPAKA